MMVLPHDVGEDPWHQGGWRYCAKCAVLFRGRVLLAPGGGVRIDNGVCPAGESHEPAGFLFVLPRRIPQDSQNDRDWRFCTKCFGMVSTKAGSNFWTVAAEVVRNSDFPGLPASQSGDGLVIVGYGWTDFYVAWMPLESAGPPLLRDVRYLTLTGPDRTVGWDPDVRNAGGLFGVANLADPNHISLAWLDGPRRWLLLYGRQETGDQKGYIVARFGTTLWDWSDELSIISPTLTPDLYCWSNPGSSPYGPYVLNRFTEWDANNRELGIYFLISLSTGYQVHMMQTRVQVD
jgi:hypothetical protein